MPKVNRMLFEEVYKRYDYLKRIKYPKTHLMQQVDAFFTPPDDVLTGEKLVGSAEFKAELLDTTGSDLIDEFVAFVLGIQFIAETRWFSLKHKASDVQSDVNRILAARADVLHSAMKLTNYYSMLTLLERDAVLHGHGGMQIMPSFKNFIDTQTLEPQQLYLNQDRFGNIIYAFWDSSVTGFELLDQFPSIKLSKEDKAMVTDNYDRQFTLVAMFAPLKDPFYQEPLPDELKKHKFFIRYFAIPQQQTSSSGGVSLMLKKQIDLDEMDFLEEPNTFFTRDAFLRSSSYGRGIGKRALPKSRVTNKLMLNLLKLSGLQANPPRIQATQVTAEAGNKGALEEGQVFTMSPAELDGIDPSKAVSLLQTNGDLNALVMLYQLQQGQLANLLPTASSIYKVARQSIAEIQQRFSELEKRLAPLRVTFLKEGPIQHIKYIYKIAEDQGKFNMEHLKLPDDVKIKDIEVHIDASTMQSFKQGKALRAAQALGLVANFLSLDPSGVLNFNIDRIIEVGFDGYNVLDLLDSRENVAQKREVQRKQVEQQQALQQQQAGFAADASNADIISKLIEANQGG